MATKTLKKGDKGREVKTLQQRLNEEKPKKKLKLDGNFGPVTEETLKEIQKQRKGKQSGVADAKFFGLFDNVAEIEITDVVSGDTMVIEATTGFWNTGEWRLKSGSLPGITARTGRAERFSVQRTMELQRIGRLDGYAHRRGASGAGVGMTSGGVLEWRVLSVK